MIVFDYLKTEDLSYKDVFNTSFEIYRRNIVPVIVLCLLVNIPLMAIEKFAVTDALRKLAMENPDLLGKLEELIWSMDYEKILTAMSSGFLPAGLERILYLATAVYAVETIVFTPLLSSGLSGLALATIDSGKGTMGDMIASSLGNIFKTTVTSLVVLIFIGIGMMLIFPALYFTVILAFSIPAIVVTGKWGFGALKESALVTIGRWFKTGGFLILIILFAFACLRFLDFFKIMIFQIVYFEFFEYIYDIISNIIFMYFNLTQCVWFINKYYVTENLKRSRNMSI